jgi:hypothetical protein
MGANVEQYQHLRPLLDEALWRDPSARQGYLDQACARSRASIELQRLLEAQEKASSFLERPVRPLPPPTLRASGSR